MKLLSKKCAVSMACPAVYDTEDGSGDVIIVGRGPLTPVDVGVTVSDGECVVRISRSLIKEALAAWQPIETAPRDGTEVLAISPAWENGMRPILLRWFKYNGLAAFRDWDADPHYPTHWQPVPSPPALALEAEKESD